MHKPGFLLIKFSPLFHHGEKNLAPEVAVSYIYLICFGSVATLFLSSGSFSDLLSILYPFCPPDSREGRSCTPGTPSLPQCGSPILCSLFFLGYFLSTSHSWTSLTLGNDASSDRKLLDDSSVSLSELPWVFSPQCCWEVHDHSQLSPFAWTTLGSPCPINLESWHAALGSFLV